MKKDPTCPVCGDAPDDHRVRRLRRVLQVSPAGARHDGRPDPTDPARRGRRRASGRGRGRHRPRRARRPRRALPGTRRADLQRRRGRDRSSTSTSAARTSAPSTGSTRAVGPGQTVILLPPRWPAARPPPPLGSLPGRLVAARPRRQHTARRAAADLTQVDGADLREARGPEPDRLDQGSRRQVDDRGGRGLRRARRRVGICSSRRPATPGIRSR